MPLHAGLCAASSKRICFYYYVTNGGSKVSGVFDLTKLVRRLQSVEAVIDNHDCYLLDFHMRVCVCVCVCALIKLEQVVRRAGLNVTRNTNVGALEKYIKKNDGKRTAV